jgi:diguanylate cyclase (GGDEF)-like protein
MNIAHSKVAAMKRWCLHRTRAADEVLFEPDRIDSGARLFVSTVLVTLAIIIMVAQNWSDRAELNRLMAGRLENMSLQLARRIGDRLALAESTLQGMDALAERVEHSSEAWPRRHVVELQRMQSSVAVQWGGTELAVLDRHGKVLAETGHLARDSIGDLYPVLDAITHDGVGGATRSLFVRGAQGQALALLRPYLAADGTVAAVLVFTVPINAWTEILEGLRLFSNSEITLLDHQRHVLTSFRGGAQTKSVLAPLPPSFGGHQNMAFVQLPADGEVVLVKERPIALPWPAGERKWTLRYGFPKAAYLGGWWLSLAFNGAVVVLVLAMWALNASATRQRRRTVEQLTRSTLLVQQMLDSLATPAALVKSRSETIYRTNARLFDRFGVQAAAGSQVSRLFERGADWAQLKQQGQGEALCMLSRSGAFRAQARCVALELDGGADSYWLLSLMDVTAQDREHFLPMPAPGTGVPHRRRCAELAANTLERSEPSALLVLELDRFVQVSQAHGSAAAERMLVTMARLLRQAVPDTAVVSPLGGGEFAVLLMAATADEAVALAQRLRAAVADTNTLLEQGPEFMQTVSVGVAVRLSGERGIDSLLERAGAALERAKAGGCGYAINESLGNNV